MDLEIIVQKHEEQLKDLEESFNNLQLDLRLFIKDYSYLTKKVEDISIDISTLIDSQKDINLSVSQFNKFMENSINWRSWFDRHWWKLISISAGAIAILWGIMDFLYKLDTKH